MLGYRKFTVTLVAILTTAVLAYLGKLSPEYMETVTWVVGAYMGGNVLKPVASNISVKFAPKDQ